MLRHAFNQVSLFTLDEDIDDFTSIHSFELFNLFNLLSNLKILFRYHFIVPIMHTTVTTTFPLEGMIEAVVIAQLIGIPTTNLLYLTSLFSI